MIKALTNCDELVLVMRQKIAEQSELPLNYVLNGETHQGAKLGHVENEYDEHQTLISSKIIPFTTSDTFIIFDLTEDSEKTRTQILDNNMIDCFTFYRMNITIYGDFAGTVCQKLKSRFTTGKVRKDLETHGVHIETFEAINSMNEYINNIYWQRKAIEVVLSCRYSFVQYSEDVDMTVMNELQIIVEQ